MDNTIDIYEEERPWGRFRKFTDNQKSTVKIIYVNPNEELSLQSHKKRKEQNQKDSVLFFTVVTYIFLPTSS